MNLPRILPLDNEERIRPLFCDGLITRGITDLCLGLAKDQQRHTQVSPKIAASTTFITATASCKPHHHQSNGESTYQQLWRSLFF